MNSLTLIQLREAINVLTASKYGGGRRGELMLELMHAEKFLAGDTPDVPKIPLGNNLALVDLDANQLPRDPRESLFELKEVFGENPLTTETL